jgi:GNAT superfamily N-acetyltransferase
MSDKNLVINLKKVDIKDLHALREIGIDSYLPHYMHLWKPGGVEWYMQRCFGDEVLQKELCNKNIEYYVAQAENENIGILKLILQKPIPESKIENALYLEKIYFVKEWIGKGVGRELINFVFKRALELNRDCVWLMAMDTSDKPISAYEKAGFTIHSRTRLDSDFELMKEEFRGMVVMKHCFGKNEN